MSQLADQKYIQISIELLLKLQILLPFDLYIKRTETKFSRLLKKDEQIDVERVNSYAAKGIEYFYVTEPDYQIYSRYVLDLSSKLREQDGARTGKELEILKELVILSVHEISTKYKLSSEGASSAALVITESIAFIEKDMRFAIKLINLLASREYLLKKSISVSIFSILLAKELGIVSKSNLQIIGLGALFHDIGTSMLSFDPEETYELTRDQRIELNRHPELGKQAIDTNKSLPQGVALIIQQHHEQPNGLGYPGRLKDIQIFPPAKIVSITSSFIALVSHRSYREAVTTEEAFRLLEDSAGKFDNVGLKAFRDLLNPKDKQDKVRASTYS